MASEQTTYLREDGDLTLIVGEEKQRVIVCRGTISGVCKAWNTMFTNSKFSEATAPEVEMPDDDPEAMLIILKIAHLKFDQLPGKKMSLDELHNLATVCDKYDTVAVIRPFLPNWIEAWLELLGQGDSERNERNCAGNEKFLWVAWVFGYKRQFKNLAKYLQLTISTNEEGRCLTAAGLVLEDEQMPPNLMGKYRSLRRRFAFDYR